VSVPHVCVDLNLFGSTETLNPVMLLPAWTLTGSLHHVWGYRTR